MVQRYEYFTEYDQAYSISGDYWPAQTFTVGTIGLNENFNITSVKLYLYQCSLGTVGTITVSIRAVNASGHPTGEDLSVGTIDGGTLKNEWREIAMSPYTLQANTKYAIVVRQDSTPNFCWRALSVGGYTGGHAKSSTDGGVSWRTFTYDVDFTFEVWGEPVAPTEGNLQITQIVFGGIEVFPTPNPVFMLEGEKASFNIKVKNIGADDHFKCELWANEGEDDFLIYGPVEFDCPADIEDWIFPLGLILTMGNKDVTIICKTFHLEESMSLSFGVRGL